MTGRKPIFKQNLQLSENNKSKTQKHFRTQTDHKLKTQRQTKTTQDQATQKHEKDDIKKTQKRGQK